MNDVMILLGNGANEEQVEVIYNQYSNVLKTILKGYDPELTNIPEELNYILNEVTIERYNLIGSEGMSSEHFEGFTASYRNDASSIFDKYLGVIDRYFQNQNISDFTKPKVRFI